MSRAPQVTAVAGPSIALTKYWGKAPSGINRPGTPSLGLTLDVFQSQATLSWCPDDHHISLNGMVQSLDRYRPFLQAAQTHFADDVYVRAECRNNFPTAAGLASSSSGFAALAYGISQLTGGQWSSEDVSQLARIGSGSAARAVFGGFTELPAGAQWATPLYDEDYWPELRMIICLVDAGSKSLSSRQAMERCRLTSPFYQDWLRDAHCLHRDALQALEARDIEKLGDIVRYSYLRMFSTMLSAVPPVLYWQPLSLSLLHTAEDLRRQGVGVWETMDAGPQVKLLCLADEASVIVSRLVERYPELTTVVAQGGNGPCLCDNTNG